MKYEVDAELQAWLDAGSGFKGVYFDTEETREFLNQAFREAWQSPSGRDLKASVGDRYNQRIAEELAKRFANHPFYPGVFFRERIEQVLQDLLLEAPPASVRPAGVNEYGVNLNFEPSREKPAPTKEETAFAHAWKKTVQEKGIAAAKPCGGVVTLTMPNGSVYEYGAQDADRLLNRCLELGLVG
jgi:hypothetical protein